MIFVTGGTGLLGSHLLFELVSRGNQVRALKRSTSNVSRVRHVFSYYSSNPDELFGKIEWHEGDLLDFFSIEDALEGVTGIYHAGAVVSFYPKDHQAIRNVNVRGTANLINAAIHKGIGKFCYVSSVATLGRADNTDLSDEETYWTPSPKNSVYGISKHEAEREVWRGMEEGLNALIVNPSVILGPGFWEDNSGLFRLVHQGLKYYTKGVSGYVDVRDCALAMILLMDGNHFGQRFILSSENLTYQDLFALIAKHLQKPAPSIHVPPLLSGIAWRIEAVRSFLTGSKPEVTKEMAVTASQVYAYSNEKIRSRAGFEFRPVEESIRDFTRYYLEDLKEG